MPDHDRLAYMNETFERWAYNNELKSFLGEELYDRTIKQIEENNKHQGNRLIKVVRLTGIEEYENYRKQKWLDDLKEILEEK